MQEMVETTMEFARGVARSEPAVEIDLAKLLSDLVEDAGAGEKRAVIAKTGSVLATVRPAALKRALRNLIDNAVRYGDKAHVELKARSGNAIITIADDGPGLPEDQFENVFEPLYGWKARAVATPGASDLDWRSLGRSFAPMAAKSPWRTVPPGGLGGDGAASS